MVPAEDGKKGKVAEECGRLVMEVLAQDRRPSQIITKESLENAIAAGAMSGGSTNLVLHLLAVANEAGVPLDIDDFDRIAWGTPLLCDLKPGGRYVATDLYRAGGVPLVIRRLEGGRPARTRTRSPSPGRPSARSPTSPRRPTARTSCGPLADPIKPNGGFAILRGNLAPGRLRREALRARAHGAPRPGAGVRVRGGRLRRRHGEVDPAGRGGRDPQRGPGRRPGHARDARRDRGARGGGPGRLGRAAHRRPLLGCHPRLHGRPRRPRGAPRRPDRRGRRTATPSSSTSPSASSTSS